jgi:hypothetical protein
MVSVANQIGGQTSNLGPRKKDGKALCNNGTPLAWHSCVYFGTQVTLPSHQNGSVPKEEKEEDTGRLHEDPKTLPI